MSIIHLDNLVFRYADNPHFSIEIDQFKIEKSSRLFLEGPSGCGKTTFLNLLTGLIPPSSGRVSILDTDITTLRHTQCDRFRADHFGIIFQLFNLIHYLSVIENITLPCMFSASRKKKALLTSGSLDKDARRLCHELDISDDLLTKPVHYLSIGQQQRVAIARALIGQPEIIIADEPTSALDNDRKKQFMTVLLDECKKYDITLIFVSHDTSLHSYFDQIYRLPELNKGATPHPYVTL